MNSASYTMPKLTHSPQYVRVSCACPFTFRFNNLRVVEKIPSLPINKHASIVDPSSRKTFTPM